MSLHLQLVGAHLVKLVYSLDIETPPEMFGPPTAEYLKHPLSKYLDYLDDLGLCICDSTLGPPKKTYKIELVYWDIHGS